MTQSNNSAQDIQWLNRARGGDKDAFGELVGCYREGVVNVVYRMCGDPTLAEDAAQEAFLRVWQHLASYDMEHSFRAWVYRIAINVALDVLRHQNRGGFQHSLDANEPILEELPDPQESLEGLVDRRTQAVRVRQAVMGLSPASRAALVLREYGGLSYTEISHALNVPMGTVMSRLNAARGQLRQTLARKLEEG